MGNLAMILMEMWSNNPGIKGTLSPKIIGEKEMYKRGFSTEQIVTRL